MTTAVRDTDVTEDYAPIRETCRVVVTVVDRQPFVRRDRTFRPDSVTTLWTSTDGGPWEHTIYDVRLCCTRILKDGREGTVTARYLYESPEWAAELAEAHPPSNPPRLAGKP